MKTIILFTITIIYCFRLSTSKPLPRGLSKVQKTPSALALSFMKQYGYIDEGLEDAEALYTETGLKEVIRKIQNFGAIPETGILDEATVELMQSARCGVTDLLKNRNKRYIIGSKGWQKRNITYYVANWHHALGLDFVRKQVKIALNTWGKYGRLNFKEVNDSSADIIIAFGSGYHGDRVPFDGPGRILAHAFFPYENGNFGGDVHFDNDENWKTNATDEEGFHFYTVALHEIGHSLGLAHTPVPNSVMFPYYTNYVTEDVLEYDDILAMYDLYIKRTLEEDKVTTTLAYDDVTSEDIPETSGESSETSEEVSHSSEDISTVAPTATVTYSDDYETVDEHKNHDDRHTIPTTNSPSLPDICQGNFDAVATLRDELFIFKDAYLWRLKDKYKIESGYPVLIRQMFPLPNYVKRIDAAYQRPDGMIVLFYGRKFWVYDGAKITTNSPNSISYYGIPEYVDKVDAVQVWAKNGKTYLYYQDHFWRFNETSRKLDVGYPKHIERWRGIPGYLDAATTWKDGITYFFKGKEYWRFNNDWVIASEKSPLPSPQLWLGCPEELSE